MQSTQNNKFLLISLFLFFLALSLRIWHLIIDPLLLRDSINILEYTEYWHSFGVFPDPDKFGIIPPFPILAISTIVSLGVTYEVSGRSIALFFGSLIPVLGFFIALSIFKKTKFGIFYGLLLCIHPTLISYSIQPLRDNIYLSLIGLTFYLLIKGVQTQTFVIWYECGFIYALAVFSRYEALEFIVVILGFLMFSGISKKKSFSIVSEKATLLFLGFFSAFILLAYFSNFDLAFLKRIPLFLKSYVHYL